MTAKPRPPMSLKPRDLFVVNWNREGIVVERSKQPAAGWLAKQTDARMCEVPEGTAWWLVLDLRGGAVVVPEPLARFVREAPTEDVIPRRYNSPWSFPKTLVFPPSHHPIR